MGLYARLSFGLSLNNEKFCKFEKKDVSLQDKI